MEVNIDNAFILAVKWSCGPCLAKYRGFTESALQCLDLIIYFLLKKPLLTTLVGFMFIILLTISLFIALIAITGVFCFIVVILLVEGFLLFISIGVISIVLSNFIFIVFGIFEIKHALKTH